MSFKKLVGVHVPHHKNTAESVPRRMPVPGRVIIPMSMHIGAPCTPTVKVGDPVKVGQVIGEPAGFVSAPIHASVSGKVTAIDDITLSTGAVCKAVVIQSDGEQTVSETVAAPTVETAAQLVAAVRASGLVGLGGAGFPTSVKLSPKDPSAVEYLLLNGAECEPYITSDLRTMLDDSGHILKCAALIRRLIGGKKVVLGIESNKPEAIALFEKLTADDPDFSVLAMPASYPQGGEKVFIYNATGRAVPEGKLPMDVGVLILNVTTAAFISRYLETGMPLIEKCVTVDGSAVANPGNVIAPIGTPLKEIFAFCGGYKAEPKKILMGGPMMGIAVPNDEVPLLKNNNAVLAFAEEEATLPASKACIRCGRCVAACPVGLMPANIDKAYQLRDTDRLNQLKVALCMECGACSFVCPAKRELVLTNKLAKQLLREQKK